MIFTEYATGTELAQGLSEHVVRALESALEEQGRASLAIPGGTTPGPLFDKLSQEALDWSHVSVMLTDERWVPETSERSNTALIKARLLQGNAHSATLVPLYKDAETPEERLRDLSAGIDAALPLSACVIGMGADMHFASIFPEADQLDAALTGGETLYAMRAPGAPEPRITLSAKAIGSARALHLMIIGGEKRDALERAKSLTPTDAPIACVLDQCHVHWAPR